MSTRWSLTDAVPLRSALVVVALVAGVLLPSERDVMALGLAAGLALVTVGEIRDALRMETAVRWPGVVRSLGPVCGAAVLLENRDDPGVLPAAVGTLLAVRACGDLLAVVAVGRRSELRPWLIGLTLVEAAGAVAALVLTELFGPAVLVTLAFVWVMGGAMVAVGLNRSRHQHHADPVLRTGPMSAADRSALLDAVFYDGPARRDRLTRFVLLLTIATVIATYGVLEGSVAAVIGGMIVAPLMGPIQALAVGLVAGAAGRALRTGIVLVGGTTLVVVVSMLIAVTSRDLSTLLMGEQVVSRTAPGLPDLAVALAAGAAGGLALVRADVSDSLPGVAIAVSLVPPLCVSGAALAGGMGEEAAGAFLLFVVNMIAITAATAAVLVLSGFGTPAELRGRRPLTIAVALGAALVGLATPLAVTGLTTVRQEALATAVQASLVDWLEPAQPAQVFDLRIEETAVTVLVASAERPPPTGRLEDAVEETFGAPVTIEVEWIATRSLSSPRGAN